MGLNFDAAPPQIGNVRLLAPERHLLRDSNTSGVGGKAEVRDLRSK